MRTSDIRLFRRLLRTLYRATGTVVGDYTCCGVTLAQCHVLLDLEEAGTTAPGTLAARLGLDKSTVSRTVDGLVGMGLVSRDTDPHDRRYAQIALTRAGRRKATRIHRSNDDAVRAIFDLIDPDRHPDILESVRTLVDAMVEARRQQAERKATPGRR